MSAATAATQDGEGLTRTEVETYFKERLADIDTSATDIAVSDVHRMPRGVSRETWSVDATITAASGVRQQGFVIRRNLHGGASADPGSLRFEYDVYARLARSPIPTAHALWYDEAGFHSDPSHRDVYVRTRVDGNWRVEHFDDPDPQWDELRIQISKEHLRSLGVVHTCDYLGLGFGEIMTVPDSPARAAITVLDYHEQRVRSVLDGPEPVLEAALARLRETAPRTPSSVGLCKGNNGMGEEVFKDGRIVAMSDWEMALIGDPAYDWSLMQQLLPTVVRDGVQIWGQEQALDYYESVSGIHIEPALIDWYRNLEGLIKFGYCQNATRNQQRGIHPGVRMAWMSVEVQYRARRMLAALAGIEVDR